MLKLTLVTPEKKVFSDKEVEEVIVPGEKGELDILPGHAPLITTLKAGILRYRLKGSTEFNKAAISWGYCEVYPEGINLLADTIELPEEIDKDRAKKAYAEAEKRLQQAGLIMDEYIRAQRKLEKERARLEL
ncbi:MAG: ATP synthase F1 subunit epsilon [Bdellovibrio sp.]|nr:MAG: ATP synthase F1 subunit epsilon [Bdellovibrio sp.]